MGVRVQTGGCVADGKEWDLVRRKDKERIVEDLKEKFAKSDVAVLTRFSGLKVSEISQLRNDFKKISVDYRVVKNTLVRRAMEGTDIALLKDYLQGPIAIALAQKDVVPVAKVLTGFAKDHPHLKIHAGLVKGRVMDAKEIEQAATLPDRDELIAKLLFLMNAPLINLLSTLREIPGKFVRTLAAIQEQKEKAG